MNDGSCIRLRPTHRNYVWSYDFLSNRTHDGRTIEFSREYLAFVTERSLKSDDVLEYLAELFTPNGAQEYIRSDSGSEFTARVIRQWLKRLGVRTLFIAPGSLWENGYNKSFNDKLRDEFTNSELFLP